MPPLLTGFMGIMAYGLWGGLIVRLYCKLSLLYIFLATKYSTLAYFICESRRVLFYPRVYWKISHLMVGDAACGAS